MGRTFRSSEPWWPPRVTAPEGAPNVVVVLVDDLGYSDLGCYGSEIAHAQPRPRSRPAGLRYANFHVTPLCSPTRAALLTGRNAHAAGVGHVANVDPGFPGYTVELPERPADRWPRSSGTTATPRCRVGKWHLSKDADLSDAGDKRLLAAAAGLRPVLRVPRRADQPAPPPPAATTDNQRRRRRRSTPTGYYLTDDLTDRAMRMIRGRQGRRPRQAVLPVLRPRRGARSAARQARRHRAATAAGTTAAGTRSASSRLARQIELGLFARRHPAAAPATPSRTTTSRPGTT